MQAPKCARKVTVSQSKASCSRGLSGRGSRPIPGPRARPSSPAGAGGRETREGREAPARRRRPRESGSVSAQPTVAVSLKRPSLHSASAIDQQRGAARPSRPRLRLFRYWRPNPRSRRTSREDAVTSDAARARAPPGSWEFSSGVEAAAEEAAGSLLRLWADRGSNPGIP